MVKYRITFDFDLDEILDQADSDHHIDIIELNDDCFYELFKTKEDIQKFEEWYNDGATSEDEKIKVIDVDYEGDYDYSSIIDITLENEISNNELNYLKDGILDYIFDLKYPTLYTNEYGYSYEMYWNGSRQEPDERKVNFDYDETYSISQYKNDKIVKL